MRSFQFDEILLVNHEEEEDEDGNQVNIIEVKDDLFHLDKEEEDNRTTTEPSQSWGKKKRIVKG